MFNQFETLLSRLSCGEFDVCDELEVARGRLIELFTGMKLEVGLGFSEIRLGREIVQSTSKWKFVFDDVKALEFEIKHFDYDDKQPFPQPHNLSKLDKDIVKIVKPFAYEKCFTGIRVKMIEFLLSIRIAMSSDVFINNPFIRMIKYLRSYVGNNLGERDYKGQDIVCDNDTMAQVKLLTLMNFSIWWYCWVYVEKLPIEESMLEICRFMLLNPYVNASKYKKLTLNLRQSKFCRSSSGSMCVWNDLAFSDHNKVFSYTVEPFTNHDAYYFTLFKDDIEKELKELSELKMPETGKLLFSSLSSVIDKKNILVANTFDQYHYFAGYCRSDLTLTTLKELESVDKFLSARQRDYSEYRSFVRSAMKAVVDKAFKDGEVYTFSEVQRQAIYFMKNTAPGFVINTDIQIQVPIIPGARLSVVDGKMIVKITRPKKKMGMLCDPNKFVHAKLLDPYTVESPGVVGSRDVPGGKETRAIFVTRADEMVQQIMIAIMLENFQFSKVGPNAPSIGSGEDYVIGCETGNVFADHSFSLYATSRINGSILSAPSDSTAFDKHSKWDNFRSGMRDGLFDSFKEQRYMDPTAPGGNLETWYRSLFGKGIVFNSIFKLPRSPGRKEGTFITIDMMRSGELITLMGNNLANYAIFLLTLRRLTEKGMDKMFTLIRASFQGDDMMSSFRINTDHRPTAQDIKAFAMVFVESAAECGHEVNFTKTIVRFRVASYLQKNFFAGMELPRLATQPFATEKIDDKGFLDEFLVGLASKYRLMCARGLNINLATKLFYMISWVLPLRYKDLHGTRAVYRPIGLTFTPISMGGLGELPFMFLGASKDSAIAYLAHLYPKLAICINKGATMAISNSSEYRDVLYRAYSKGNITPGSFKAGIGYLKQIMASQKSKNASEALITLDKIRKGAFDPENSYLNLPESTLKAALAGIAETRDVVAYAKIAQGKELYRKFKLNVVSADILKEFKWVTSFSLTYLGNVHSIYDINALTPSPCSDELVSRLINIFGVTELSPGSTIQPSQILKILKSQDRDFPRHITAEGLMKMIDDPIIMSNPDYIAYAFIAIGAEAKNARLAAVKVFAELGSLSAMNAVRALSHHDEILPKLNFSKKNLMRFCSSIIEDSFITTILHNMFIFIFLWRYMVLKLANGISISPVSGSWETIISSLRGGEWNSKYWKLWNDYIPTHFFDTQDITS